jgi:hypothetical protein
VLCDGVNIKKNSKLYLSKKKMFPFFFRHMIYY